MSDDADNANEHIERERAGLLSRRRPVGPQPNGRCYFCDEIVGDEDRWCGPKCRDAYEKDTRRRS